MRAGERAYWALREDIVEWRLPPGTVLGEVEQAERLGVSRTPLREALGRLTAEGLTAPHSGRGVVVAAISLENITEIFELRSALECQAASLAARRGDPAVFARLQSEFSSAAELLGRNDPGRHDYYELVSRLDSSIDQAIGNPYLLQALKNLRVHLVRIRRLAKDNPLRLLAAATEHANIAGAIASGDSQLAAAATAVHLHQSLEHLKSTQQSSERTAS
ncbi:GntR family transcriptional regulator [Arthrobacter crystallopoietes BAB-32]|uniref:GntR family transcriptional regulator n=1 Tax=Arthrobacter crystallopoietes BAB-32 TaxID=1246476 RepID=N1UVG3_9MICC|nr:GntR family transcriptional regulator [Arthrobacter crystallopoietes]EMY33055.1 GntR family transcriptional regulator [Arthrobacter crystallopoietes BAB-32]